MTRIYMNIIVSIACLLLLHSSVTGFSCYKCISNDNPPCLGELKPNELPPTVGLVDCEGFCTLVRTEYTDIPGEVITLVRDCAEEEPLVLNDVRTDKHYTKMYTTCREDRCNSGNGTREPGESDGPRRGPSSVIIVPESSGSVAITSVKPLGTFALCLGILKWNFHI